MCGLGVDVCVDIKNVIFGAEKLPRACMCERTRARVRVCVPEFVWLVYARR